MRSIVVTILRATNHTPSCHFITTSSFLQFASSNRNSPAAKPNNNPASGGSSSSPNARAQPKVYNSNITGSGLKNSASQLTEGQKKEVDEHNRTFSKKQNSGKEEKLDDKFWKGSSKR